MVWKPPHPHFPGGANRLSRPSPCAKLPSKPNQLQGHPHAPLPRQTIAAALALLLAPASALCFTVGNLKYEFQNDSDTEMYVSDLANSSATDITIPSPVQYTSRTYRVTSIGS